MALIIQFIEVAPVGRTVVFNANERKGNHQKLKAAGFLVISTEGSHVRLGKGSIKVSVPLHGAHDVRPGTLGASERQSGVRLK